MARVRVRRHANPFNVQGDPGPLDRMALFGREGPLEVELGSAAGGFLRDRALAHPELDFVGLEVRAPLVEAFMARREREGPRNAVLLYANANASLMRLVPAGVVQMFHVHFPDPWFKKRHWKRRIVQPASVRMMSTLLPIGGRVYAQSDVPLLAEEMYTLFAADGALESLLGPGLLVPRPITESTEWEQHHEAIGEPVYRMWFEKRREPAGPVPDVPLRRTQLPRPA